MNHKYSVKLNVDIKLFKSDLHPVEFIRNMPHWNNNLYQDPKKASHFGIPEEFWSHELLNFFTTNKQQLVNVEVFYSLPNFKLTIHSDGLYHGDYTKINWVFGGKDSQMIWYENTKDNTDDKLILHSVWNTPAITYSPDEVNVAYAEYLQGPNIVAVGCPHNVVNQSEERFAVSALFRNNETKNIDNRPTMEESIEIFKDYIVIDQASC